MLPPAALARLQAIRDAMPARTVPQHVQARCRGKRKAVEIMVARARQEPAELAPSSTEDETKPKQWPDPGGVRWAFEEARKKR